MADPHKRVTALRDNADWDVHRDPITEQAPDWVCEVVSPTTAALDRRHKIHIYSRERVAHLWLVDPLARTLEVYRLEGDHWALMTTHAGSERIRAEPFEAIAIDLGRWWLEA